MPKATEKVPAIFFDRDGTIIEDVGFLTSADSIRILPNTATGLMSLREAGYRLVVVTNQSAVARGLLEEEHLQEIHNTLSHHLEMLGAGMDAFYWCPHLPDSSAARSEYAVECDCRKPKPGLILRAAEEMNIDLSASWMVGDAGRDVEAGQAAGLKTIKLTAPPGHTDPRSPHAHPPTAEAKNVNEAAEIILATHSAPGEAIPIIAEERAIEEEEKPEPAAPEEPAAELPPEETVPQQDEAVPEAIEPALEEEEPQQEPTSSPIPDETVQPEVEKAEEVPMTELAAEKAEDAPAEEPVADVAVHIEPAPGEPVEPAPGEHVEPEEEPVTEPEPAAQVAEAPTEEVGEEPDVEADRNCRRCGAIIPSGAEAGLWHGRLLCAECMAKVGHVVRGGAPGARAEAEGGEPDDSTILRQVLHEVRRLVHRPESEAFSLLRLFAYLVQVAALFVGLVLVIVVEDKSVFIQMGILLQLLALTLFYIEKKQ